MMQELAVAFGATLVSMAVFDGLWLGIMGSRFYRAYLGHLMAARTRWVPAVVFYPVYALSIVVLVVRPALALGWGAGEVFLVGAMLGCAAYGAYNFTNHATLSKWPLAVTVVDLSWGTMVTGVVSMIALVAARWL